MPISSAQHAGAIQFKALVEKYSEGRLQVDVFPAQQLGSDPEMVTEAREGNLAVTLPPTSKITALITQLKILDIPFLFENESRLYEVLNSEMGEILKKEFSRIGLISLGYWGGGFKQMTANRKINDPKDFFGLRFRIMRSEILKDQVLSLGAFPAIIDFHQVKGELEKGVIDAQENPVSSIFSMGLHKFQSHFLKTDHAYLLQALVFSKKIFAKLDKNNQEAVIRAARESTVFQKKRITKLEVDSLLKIRESGIEVNEITAHARNNFIDSFASIYYQNRKEIEKLEKHVNSYVLEQITPKIVLGLNQSMSENFHASAISIKRGVDLAVKEINSKGGILGKKLIVQVKDHGGFPARGIQNMEFFAKQKDVMAVIGGMHSPVVLSELDTVHKMRIPYLIPWAAASNIISNKYDTPYIFRLSVRDEYAGPFLTQEAEKFGKNIALLLENTPWGKSNHKAILETIASSSSKISSIKWFEWGETNFKKRLEEIINSNADVIIYVGNAPEGIHFLKSMYDSKTSIPIISHWGITGGKFWQLAKKYLKLIDLRFLQTFILEDDEKSQISHFFGRYREYYSLNANDVIPAPFGTIHAYDLVHLFAKALTLAGKLDRDLLRDKLISISNFKGAVKQHISPFSKKLKEGLGPEDLNLGRYNDKGAIVLAR